MGGSAKRSRWTALAALGALAACDGNGTGPVALCDRNVSQNVTLAVAAYVALAPGANAGCLILFPGNASSTDSAEYLVVPQIATDAEGATAPFLLDGDTLHPVLAAQLAGPVPPDGAGVAEQFHDFLRAQERHHWPALGPAPRVAAAEAMPGTPFPPPVVGNVRVFSVCRDLSCGSFRRVTATAKTVSGHLAIYVDTLAPPGGLTPAELDALGVLIDSRLYAIDTTAFGRESDIDANTVVIVLMTNVVNQLVNAQQCASQGFVAGFFLGADIDPGYVGDPRVNHGEVFYSIVADPNGTLSCAHSASLAKRLVPVTFVHEFQHMISFNQHVLLRRGAPQATWLDEGMSHLAEELGGRSFLPDSMAPDYVIGDLFNAYSFLDSPGLHFLAFSSGIGTLAERGAAWLFVRYITDQFRTDTTFTATAAFTRSLEQTNLLGGANVAAATGTPFETLAERWALASYVADLPGFGAPPELRYTSWNFRTTYDSLNKVRPTSFPKPFPLTPPASSGSAVGLSGTLKAGSGVYALALQGLSAPGFTLFFSGPNDAVLPSASVPRLNVIRIR